MNNQIQNPQPGAVNWAVVLLALGVVTSGLCVVIYAKKANNNNIVEAPVDAAAPPNREARLSGVALYKSRIGFEVCSRQALHQCVVTFGTTATLESTTIRLGPIDVGAVDSCENLGPRAVSACSDAGDGFLTPGGPSPPWIQCVARHGLLYRGSRTVTIVDPRDENDLQRPGALHIGCLEGYRDGSFENSL